MHESLIELLQCPSCGNELAWSLLSRRGNHIHEATAHCQVCGATYVVHEGIGAFLTPDLDRHDLWEETESGLIRFLRAHAETERQMMGTPLDALNGADLMFRAMVHEDRGEYAEAATAELMARSALYTPEYLACFQQQLDQVVHLVQGQDGAIVDLASGRGMLADLLASRVDNQIIVTDFSLSILLRNRRRWRALGIDESRLSLLAFDARRTPFKDRSVTTLTTNLGLPNIEGPDRLLQELRRIVSGQFYAITTFYPENDEVNRRKSRELGIETLLFNESTLREFSTAGWSVDLTNACQARALPTTRSAILEGMGIDAMPVAETQLDWCVLVGN